MNELKVKKEDAVLVLIDFQERLMPAMAEAESLVKNAENLIRGCRVLGVPHIVTQQYTKGLGETVLPLRAALTESLSDEISSKEFTCVEKTTFSAMREPGFVEALAQLGKKTVIICGIEAHICLQQTAIDLVEAGFSVFVAADCISSRTTNNKEYSQVRLAQVGCTISNYESLLYEMLVGAKEAGFKQISAIVK